MKAQDRLIVNAALDHVLANRYVCGVLFYAGYPRLVVDELNETAKPVREGIGVYVASTWKLFDSRPGDEIGDASGFPEQSISDLCRTAGELMNVRITAASVAAPVPHLQIEFANGCVLVLDGASQTVEGWEVNGGDFGILANQGDGVAYWTPDHFAEPARHAS